MRFQFCRSCEPRSCLSSFVESFPLRLLPRMGSDLVDGVSMRLLIGLADAIARR